MIRKILVEFASELRTRDEGEFYTYEDIKKEVNKTARKLRNLFKKGQKI